MAFDIIELLSIVGLSSIISIILSGFVSWLSTEHEFKREQNISYVKERLDKFYSPMLFHFENMRSWAAAHGHKSGYVFAAETLGDKLEDMKGLMRSGMRLVSPRVEELWYAWQPFAVAVVERKRGTDFYPKFSNEEFQTRSEPLHTALKADREKLMTEFKRLSKNTDVSLAHSSSRRDITQQSQRWKRLFYDAFLALGAGSYGAFFAISGKTILHRIASGDYLNAAWTSLWGIVGMIVFVGVLYYAQPDTG